jgi:radical SAM PhpK family P-methyltransferase
MEAPLDCVVIGYNDPPFSFHEHRIMAQEERSPERRAFMREHLLLNGTRMPCMDVVNHYARSSQKVGANPYYHVGEVPNLAAAYLASYLRKQHLTAEYVSLFRPERDRLADILEHRRPQVLAITTTFYLMPWPVHEICTFVRELSPATVIVIGGPLIDNLAIDLGADSLAELFSWMGGSVYVRESQGEATLAEIVHRVRQGLDLSAVPNIYLPGPEGFRFTRRRPEANNLDECAIDWGICSAEEPLVTAQTRTARSCAFKCSFCDFPERAGPLNLASVEVVERELRQLARRGVRQLVFVDDTFNVPIGRFKELCQMMIRNDFGFEWFSFFRCSAARNREIYDLMARSGCRGVFLGVESGDSSVLKNMVKSSHIDQYRFGIEQLHERGIVTFASFICGFPGETMETTENTIKFINDTSPTFYRAELWYYNHRTPVHRARADFGLTGAGYDWRHDTMNTHTAGDAADSLFRDVTGSVWMPGYNYDFWAIPYLLGKGMSVRNIVRFQEAVRDLMCFNSAPPAGALTAALQARRLNDLDELFAGIRLTPPRYQLAATLTRRPSR